MKKKAIIAVLVAVLLVCSAFAIYGYQVDSTGALPMELNGNTYYMAGYLTRANSSSYSFSAETTTANPYSNANISVSVVVVPYNTSLPAVSDSDAKVGTTHVAASAGSVSTTNGASAGGGHGASIYYGTQGASNSGSTSWIKS